MKSFQIFYTESPRSNVAAGSFVIRAKSAFAAELKAGSKIALAYGYDGAPKRWVLSALTKEISA